MSHSVCAWAEPRHLPLTKSNSTTCGEIHKIVNALCRYVFVFHFVVSHLNYVKHLQDENADVALQKSVFTFKKTLDTFITKLFCRKEKKLEYHLIQKQFMCLETAGT
jgi:hypothetical protein